MEEQAAAGTFSGSNPLGFYILHLENCIQKKRHLNKQERGVILRRGKPDEGSL